MNKLKKRFWSKVKIGNPEQCWPWLACTNNGGYGKFGMGSKWFFAHRVAWTLVRGEICRGKLVLHTCDNRVCVNPDHLFIGTHQDNTHDAISKGRNKPSIGSKNGRAKLSERDILTIRGRLFRGDMGTHIAEDYGVTPAAICRINTGNGWTHV